MTWTVLVHPQAKKKLAALPTQEKVAVDNAMKKLEALGPDLSYPYSSAVQWADAIRELRPRSGRSPWRAFYRRIDDVFLVGAIGRRRRSIQGSSTSQSEQQRNESTA